MGNKDVIKGNHGLAADSAEPRFAGVNPFGHIAPIITGPLVVDASNAQMFKDLALEIFGEDGYYKLSPY